MTIMYSVELEANQYGDDLFCGTFDECVQYIKDFGYEEDETIRIAKILVDDDGCMAECLDIIEEW